MGEGKSRFLQIVLRPLFNEHYQYKFNSKAILQDFRQVYVREREGVGKSEREGVYKSKVSTLHS